MYNVPSPEELRQYRLRIGLTQTELARKAKVSQSLIARIEKGAIDPRLSTLKKILGALKEGEKTERVTARELMRAPVITVSPEDSLKKASKLMEEHNISQMPVVRKGVQVGSISETQVIHELTSGKDLSELSSMKVADIMGSGFPIVTADTDVETLSNLVEHNPCVLVVDRERLSGIVTKADVLKLVK
ncbi:MAG: CBS domain-containing protein [Methanobacteriota archaeon]|nr:MAG: CBS domain-containing protein [Euryarchaeota archaeon]